VVELDTDNRTAAWADLKEDVEANPGNYTDRFASRIRETVATAENETGRPMAADRFSVAAENRSAGQSFGVLRYTYRWTNFAQTADGRLEIGDAIAGFYLSDATRLTILWPEGYTAERVDPSGDERREDGVTWRGSSTNFVDGEPRVVATAGGGGGGGGIPMTAVLGGLALAAVLAGLGFYLTRDDDAPPAVGEDVQTPGATEAAGAEGSADQSPAAASETTVDAGDAAGAGAASGAADDGGAAGTAADDAEDVPEDLLSNEERVLKLLREQGGRMKQQEIVDETGWTDAKTSQVLSDMREEGSVDGFRLGRENVITLPDADEPGP